MIQETTHDLRIIYNLSQNMLNRTRMDRSPVVNDNESDNRYWMRTK